MTMQLSVSARNAMLAAILAQIGPGASLKLRTGPQPATTAAADTGTVIATFALPDDFMTAPANGVTTLKAAMSKAAEAAGYAGHFRIYSAGGACQLSGLVAQPWAAATAFVVGQQVHNNGLVYRCTAAGNSAAAAPGPVGTGGAIADGGVTWAYVGLAFMNIDNTNFAVGQNAKIDNLTLTGSNA